MYQIGESRTKKPQQQLNTQKTATEHYHRVGQHRTAAHRRWAILLCRFFFGGADSAGAGRGQLCLDAQRHGHIKAASHGASFQHRYSGSGPERSAGCFETGRQPECAGGTMAR